MRTYGQLEISRMAFDGENERRFVDADEAEALLNACEAGLDALARSHTNLSDEEYRAAIFLMELAVRGTAYCRCDAIDCELAAFEGSSDKMIRCPFQKDSQGRCTNAPIRQVVLEEYDLCFPKGKAENATH